MCPSAVHTGLTQSCIQDIPSLLDRFGVQGDSKQEAINHKLMMTHCVSLQQLTSCIFIHLRLQ